MGVRLAVSMVLSAMLVALLPPADALACAPRTSAHLGPTPTERAALEARGEERPEVPGPPSCRFVYTLEYPVVGGGQYLSGFGAPRDGGDRWHLGVDIAAPRMTPVVAARAGTVTAVHTEPDRCCWLAIRHDDGWSTRYIHLNNDTFGTDDGLGVGIRPGLEVGDRVEQGELVGWIGDSGNAEPGIPHLHFELRTPSGVAVDALPSLRAARWRLPSAFPDAAEGRPVFDGAFGDDDDHPTAELFDTVSSWGMPVWCDIWGVRSCPDEPLTRTQALAWIGFLGGSVESAQARALFSPEPPPSPRADDPNAILVLEGCLGPVLCHQPVERHQLAALTVLSGRVAGEAPSSAEAALRALHAEGAVDACLPAEGSFDRGAALAMLLRAFGYLPAPPCGQIS